MAFHRGSHGAGGGGLCWVRWKRKRQPMAWGALAAAPSGWNRVVSPTRHAHDAGAVVRFVDENAGTVPGGGTDRLPFWKHSPPTPVTYFPTSVETPMSRCSSRRFSAANTDDPVAARLYRFETAKPDCLHFDRKPARFRAQKIWMSWTVDGAGGGKLCCLRGPKGGHQHRFGPSRLSARDLRREGRGRTLQQHLFARGHRPRLSRLYQAVARSNPDGGC